MDTLTALICLSGSPAWSLPLIHAPVPFLVPFGNQPLIRSVLQRLKQAGVIRAVLILDELSASWLYPHRELLAATGLELDYLLQRQLLESETQQTALLDRLDPEQPVLLLQDPFPDCANLADFLAFHQQQQADCSVRLLPAHPASSLLQPVWLTPDQRVQSTSDTSSEPDFDSRLYLLETDLLEEMLTSRTPLLKTPLSEYFSAQAPYYYGWRSHSPLAIWHQLRDYLAVQAEFWRCSGLEPEGQLSQKAEGHPLWLGEGTVCASRPLSQGWVVIGRNCKIGADVELRGPILIGHDTEIGDGCVLSNTTIWFRSQIAAGCRLSDSLIASRCQLGEGCELQASLVSDQSQLGAGRVLQPGEILGPFTRLGDAQILRNTSCPS